MSEVSNETGSNDLRVMPGTLYADRPDGSSLFLDRINGVDLGEWLRERGLSFIAPAAPVVVLVDQSASRSTGEFCDLVALEYGEERPLKVISEAIAALQMTYAALVAAGQVDFESKDDQ
ncbi:hypothetical protein [Kribbella sp.]|uniref:hypothetical protein n=1 Tax=Kribbella sp. TaxID=1871183 RepID=UPI002D3C1F79|nr:hypothetical protein [Kribbella sp.]HZX05669.1 hypothetical protein [Kribbella sp.]